MANKSYTKKYIEDALQQLLPPLNKSVTQLSKELEVSKNTIYTWRKVAREKGELIPNSNSDRIKKWRKEDKLRIVIETFSLNEAELAKYCRIHGLYTSDIENWRKLLETTFDNTSKPANILELELKEEKNKVKKIKKDLDKKNKALAETAAILVLKKKINTIWGDPEDD